MSRDQFKKWVCTAIEMEEKGKKFYEKAVEDCKDGLGREIFIMLRDDEVRHIDRIKEIEKALDQGQDVLEQACSMPADEKDMGKMLRDMASKVDTDKACSSTESALNTGIEFELALVKFYEDALEKAQEDIEKEFLKKMVAEEKAHYVLLEDLKYYYEDPEGWAMGQGKSGLDGA
ncbi:ferritin-like domain-containing protein [Desulfonatronovibrio magnus]|uniref:ferritin-like domain-containing protein n=1 Tax=Desulfonatronovibrio magnus TaxID=698827 RepID=UPI0005EB3D3F|nr:ferritin family protein [Desulfonatronovibrio magnus]